MDLRFHIRRQGGGGYSADLKEEGIKGFVLCGEESKGKEGEKESVGAY